MTIESWDAWVRSGRTIRGAGHDIFVRTEGTGPTLLFLHGFPTSSFDYAAIIAQLTSSYRCVAFDFLGFGASAKPVLAYDYELQLQVVEAVVAAERIERATVVAHDYAVTVGQELLARDLEGRAPFAIDGMLFMNGGLASALHRPIAVQRLLASRLGVVIAPLIFREALFERSMRKIIRRFDRFDVHEHYASLTSNGGARVIPRLLAYIAERRRRGPRWEDAIRRTTRPLAFVWGVDDPISGGHVLDWIRTAAPHATVTGLAGTGHYPQIEEPDAVAQAIRSLTVRPDA
ncbi:MAG: alpha/beta hydrolase [Kofleriaceae bacterium]